MATTTKVLSRAAAATSIATLYTVPASTTAVVTNIVVTNSGSAGTFTLYLNGVDLFYTAAIAANSTAAFDLKQVLNASQTITGLATSTAIKFHISGVEIN